MWQLISYIILTHVLKIIKPLFLWLICLLNWCYFSATNVQYHQYFALLDNLFSLWYKHTSIKNLSKNSLFTHFSENLHNDLCFNFSHILTCNEFSIAPDRVDNVFQFNFFFLRQTNSGRQKTCGYSHFALNKCNSNYIRKIYFDTINFKRYAHVVHF